MISCLLNIVVILFQREPKFGRIMITFTFVVKGKMRLESQGRNFWIEKGKAYFIQKGAFAIPEFFPEQFCDLIIFLTAPFLKEIVQKHQLVAYGPRENLEEVVQIEMDSVMLGYYQSLFALVKSKNNPSAAILKVKLEELLLIIFENPKNKRITTHIANYCTLDKISITQIMENNYAHPLKIQDYAKMTARSISTFQREFKKIYSIPPARWLRDKRLAYGRLFIGAFRQ